MNSRLVSASAAALLAFSLGSQTLFGADPDPSASDSSSNKPSRMNMPERRLFQESIRSTKQSIAKDMLDVLYKDAVEFYRQKRYNDALEQLDQIYSVDPEFEDVAALRETIRRIKDKRVDAGRSVTVREFMRKANEAVRAGQNVTAIHQWEQALVVDPDYAPARKKIQEMKHHLAQKEFEAGYIHHRHGEMEDALDSWSNAIALDPSFKQRGLLLLMSKIELNLKRDRVGKLAAQAYEQYTLRQYEASLQSYLEVLKTNPRHEEARRMSSKLKILLGEAAYQDGQQRLKAHQYAEAIEKFNVSMGYGYEIVQSSKNIHSAQLAMAPRPPTPAPVTKPKPKPSSSSSSEPPPPPPKQVSPEDAAAAMEHYRAGLRAIRNKDYAVAVSELDAATALDPINERIYMAQQRARQLRATMTEGQ